MFFFSFSHPLSRTFSSASLHTRALCFALGRGGALCLEVPSTSVSDSIRAELLSDDSVLLWMLKLIMVLLWMILLVFLLCAEAENMTEVRGELGTNVTLTCSNQTSDRYWYMEIHSQFRAGIGRSFSSADSTYYSPGFETKFSILGNKLVIKNLTAEDCRLYFCGIKRGGSTQFVETFHLISGN
uniref:Immunoglobulin domain-containing protein n=1 Tax=Pundamilia nyererei TaxID=303518 RepID=A0A3B4H874_9CICH